MAAGAGWRVQRPGHHTCRSTVAHPPAACTRQGCHAYAGTCAALAWQISSTRQHSLQQVHSGPAGHRPARSRRLPLRHRPLAPAPLPHTLHRPGSLLACRLHSHASALEVPSTLHSERRMMAQAANAAVTCGTPTAGAPHLKPCAGPVGRSLPNQPDCMQAGKPLRPAAAGTNRGNACRWRARGRQQRAVPPDRPISGRVRARRAARSTGRYQSPG